MQLSKDQQNALDAFNKNKNMFLTGPGGSGKTALIRTMYDAGIQSGKVVQVCAMTGCAAVLLGCPNAKTIHSWAGIGLCVGEASKIIEKVTKNKYKRAEWKKPDVLIIDEISMMSAKLFDILDILGKKCRKQPTLPFGGIQIIMSGDFYQLPPIKEANELDSSSSAFCFESPRWNFTFDSVIQLSTIFRQTDERYIKILNQLRVGKLSKKTFQTLSEIAKNKKSAASSKDITPTILLPRRRAVDNINKSEMNKLTGERMKFKLMVNNKLPIDKKQYPDIHLFPHTVESIDAEIKYLRSNTMAEAEIELAVGAQVLCVANIDMEGPYPVVNGSQGIVTEFVNNLPMVEFKDKQKRIIGYHTWRSDNVPGLGVKQIPLIHAWAITIHKAQGVSLDLAEIDAGSGIFECGQTYVALSRVKTLEGLHLTRFDLNKIKVNRKVQAFYASIQ